VKKSKKQAFTKMGSTHLLRHSYAMQLLKGHGYPEYKGVLDQKFLQMMMRYTHVSKLKIENK
jgi:site-specific recombinase XerD